MFRITAVIVALLWSCRYRLGAVRTTGFGCRLLSRRARVRAARLLRHQRLPGKLGGIQHRSLRSAVVTECDAMLTTTTDLTGQAGDVAAGRRVTYRFRGAMKRTCGRRGVAEQNWRLRSDRFGGETRFRPLSVG